MLGNFLDFFIGPAQAATTAVEGQAPQAGSPFMLVIMLVFVGFMYLTVWRPQSKRAKDHKDLLGRLTSGDEVVTAGGILGKVSKLTDSFVVLSVADNVNITVQRSSIGTVLPKGTIKSV